ncbi:MAG: 23S rRNA (adenine(2503)-C(2))-methyltransferase RlmN [Chitinispirillales bacterium]|jgi:23S rRNA (adenine2503-C2)-methyltransferase|nr:23S rRNA (adenine(2503)-C(2))-methyltransferase RlmN [Chitinispirillales bacterium]
MNKAIIEKNSQNSTAQARETTRLKNLSLPQIEEFVLSLGGKKFHGRQIYKWIYQRRLSSFDAMTDMSKAFRAQLEACAGIDKLEARCVLESKFGDAVKFGFKLCESEHLAESVLLIDDNRRTACISSQLGCALGCAFCETGKLGFIRNLTQEEILGQIIGINDYLFSKGDKLITNIVFMGMGEVLSNFNNFLSSLSVIMDEGGFGIGARRITVSTAGVVPSIERLMKEDLTIGLAISLNAWNNELRNSYMPVNRKYPIEQLVEIAKRYYNKTGRRVTFEYVLINGVTDTPAAAAALHALLGGFPCKINLIPVNPAGNAEYNSPNERQVNSFFEELQRRGLTATVRRSRGQDICGACGQLTGGNLE